MPRVEPTASQMPGPRPAGAAGAPKPTGGRIETPAVLRAAGNACLAGVLVLAKSMVRLGVHGPPDGWRRAMGVGLRSQGSRFVLSAFGLDLWSDLTPPPDAPEPAYEAAQRHFVKRFAEFLRNEPIARCELEHTRSLTDVRSRQEVDVTFARFGPEGELQSVELVLDPAYPLAPPREDVLRARILPAFLETYNALGRAWDDRPPPEDAFVPAELDGSPAAPGAASGYVRRVLGGTFVSFEEPILDPSSTSSDPPARFVMPDFLRRKTPGLAPLNVVCRLSLDHRTVDVWVQVHHAALDGAPVQEMLTRLEQAWGVARPPTYPAPGAFRPQPAAADLCSVKGSKRRLYHVQDFVDFTPLTSLRQDLSARPPVKAAGPVSVAALLLWCLAHQPEFFGKNFGTTIDVAPGGGRNRAVGFLPIRPGEYFDELNRAAGFASFVHDFNRLLADTRARRGPACRALDTMALLPPWLQTAALRLNREQTGETFGTVGLSILRDAKVFIAPMADIGFEDGFISVGNMALPAAGGARVGSVSVKGPDRKVAGYPDALRRAVTLCRDYV